MLVSPLHPLLAYMSDSLTLGERRIRFWLFWVIATAVILVGGGRIVSSDETSTFLTIESIVRHGILAIPLNSPNAAVFDGKAYSWYEPGIILAGIPFYLVGNAAVNILPLSASQAELFLRAIVSCTSAFVAGWLAVMFYALCRRFHLNVKQALMASLILVFSTFLFPYFKSFMREPLLTICLLGGASGVLAADGTAERRWPLVAAGLFLGFGILTKTAFVINVIPILIYLAGKLYSNHERSTKQKVGALLAFGMPILVVGFGGIALYNFLRFGDPLNLGYSGGTTFTTPLLTGLFGLLLSPGKGLAWFAPVLLLLPWTFTPFWKEHRKEAGCVAGIVVLNLLLYGLYTAWGGDGSWGPRYLSPLLPILLLPVVLYLARAGPALRRFALVLVVAGVGVQIGGTAVYAGSYLREIQEYPYQRNFDDPEFLYKAHFIPDFSPIIGHWKILLRNGGEHFRGEYPSLAVEVKADGGRLPIQKADQAKLSQTLDFWFTYALYAGISGSAVLGLLLVVLSLWGISVALLRRGVSELQKSVPTV
jgi:hypothetical protein